MDDALYREEILDHYHSSAYRGCLDHADLSAELDNPLCGDQIRFELELDTDWAGDSTRPVRRPRLRIQPGRRFDARRGD